MEVSIPFEYHRYIIGMKGREIRSLMDDHNVNIAIPSPDKKVCKGWLHVEFIYLFTIIIITIIIITIIIVYLFIYLFWGGGV